MMPHDKRVSYISTRPDELVPHLQPYFGGCVITRSHAEYTFTDAQGIPVPRVTVPDVMLWVRTYDGTDICVPVEVKISGKFEAIRGKVIGQLKSLYRYLDWHPELGMQVPGLLVVHGGRMDGRRWRDYGVEFLQRYDSIPRL